MKTILHFTRFLSILAALVWLSAGPVFPKEDGATESGKEVIEMKEGDTEPVEDGKNAPPADEKKKEKAATEEKTGGEDTLSEEKPAQFKFKGQVKNLYLFHRTDNFMGEDPLTLSSKNLSADLTRVRLSPEFQYKELLTMKVDFDNEVIWSNYGKSQDFTSYWRPSGYNDFLDLTWEPYRDRDVMYRIKLNRAYVKLSVDKFTATVGRQQIRFGSGKLWNPLDILNPVSPTFVEGGDEQKGTDAIKLDFYPEEKTEITGVVDFKKSSNEIEHFNMQDCNYILRVKTSVKDTDIAVLGGYVARRGVAGFDFAAILFGGMLRGSVLAYKPEKESIFFQANAGYEYNFKAGVYILGEYLFNQKAINYNDDLKAAVFRQQLVGSDLPLALIYNLKPSAEYHALAVNLKRASTMNQSTYDQIANQLLTVNQHYLALALGYDFHPLVRGELFTIGDIQGRGIFWGPTLKINAYENLDFTVGIMGAFTFDNKSSDFSEFRKNYLFYASGSYVF